MHPTKRKYECETEYPQNITTKFHKTSVKYSVSDEKKKDTYVPREKCVEYFYID
jgi:hypothetical protein